MTYQDFRRQHPATRCFQRYTSEQRADLAASFRLGPRQRAAVGEHYYVHEMLPEVCFPTAKLATTRAYEAFTAKMRVAEEPTRIRVVADQDREAEAEHEAFAEEASTQVATRWIEGGSV